MVVAAVAVQAGSCKSRRAEESSSGAASQPAGAAGRNDGVKPIKDLSSLPPASGGGTIAAALDCWPSDKEFRDGYMATWPLAVKQPPRTAMWIVQLDEKRKIWKGSGDFALVSADGAAATGKLYHFSSNAVQNTPPDTWATMGHYQTEWVWLLANYSREMDKLARAVSNKYRDKLKIPPLAYVTADQWLAEGKEINVADDKTDIGGIPIDNGRVTIADDKLLKAARREFKEKKDLYEDTFGRSFGLWMDAATTGDAAGAVAIWQCVADLRFLDKAWKSESGWLYDFWGELGKWARGKLAGKLASLYQKGLGVKKLAALMDIKLGGVTGWATGQGEGWVKDRLKQSIADGLTELTNGPKTKSIPELVAILTAWGDTQVLELAWPDVDAAKPPAGDPRRIGAAEGFATGPGVLAGHDVILDRRFQAHPTIARIKKREDQTDPYVAVYRTPQVIIDYSIMRDLIAKGQMEVSYNHHNLAMTDTVQVRDLEGFDDLKKQFQQIEKDLDKLNEAGIKLWTDAMHSGNHARIAACLRLYSKDLQAMMASQQTYKKLKAGAMDAIADKLIDALPSVLSWFGSVVKTGISSMDDKTPREKFAETIEEQSILAASMVSPAVPKTVFADRVPDLAKLMKLKDGFDDEGEMKGHWIIVGSMNKEMKENQTIEVPSYPVSNIAASVRWVYDAPVKDPSKERKRTFGYLRFTASDGVKRYPEAGLNAFIPLANGPQKLLIEGLDSETAEVVASVNVTVAAKTPLQPSKREYFQKQLADLEKNKANNPLYGFEVYSRNLDLAMDQLYQLQYKQAYSSFGEMEKRFGNILTGGPKSSADFSTNFYDNYLTVAVTAGDMQGALALLDRKAKAAPEKLPNCLEQTGRVYWYFKRDMPKMREYWDKMNAQLKSQGKKPSDWPTYYPPATDPVPRN
jgi:hypothetical protein